MKDISPAYTPAAIEFAAVATETSVFFEKAKSFEKTDFLQRTAKLLALLYLKTSMLPDIELQSDEELEDFVTEQDYEFIHQSIGELLGENDTYLETFHPDMPLSDTPIAVFISEDIADIYQDLKNFALRYQIGNEEVMNDALAVCRINFREFWGQKLVNCLRAIHNIIMN
ncbi:MAG: DUF5063 domain-containing protein [Prevotellaceae bacterium]|jgi:hypothetical protein|nr:DUF5063 domain-containing protein [Prevotellaceae bacterium]